MSPDRGTDTEHGQEVLSDSIERLDIQDDQHPLPSALQSPSSKPAPEPPPCSTVSPEESTDISTPATVPPHLSHDPSTNAKRTDPFQFGQRYLSSDNDVFEYNAWDHVTPDSDHLAFAEAQYSKQRSAPVSDFDRNRFNKQPEKWWDLFYKQKSATFFKDRKWLVQEFPVLGEVTSEGAGRRVVLEVGAGAGNTAFPVMRINENEALELVAVDFSRCAVDTMRNAQDYTDIAQGRDGRKGKMRAEVWDVTSHHLPEGVEEGSVDVVVMIFIFSALSPQQWTRAVRNVWRLLKPGGEVLFRDYGRGDLAQVRFKAGRWMDENFYVRGDGTRVYFFEKQELERIWTGTSSAALSGADVRGTAGTRSSENPNSTSSAEDATGSCDLQLHRDDEGANVNKVQETQATSDHDEPDGDAEHAANPCLEVLNLDVDRRLIVNRQRRIKMYRCWIQGRFRKPETRHSLD